ncbi:PREDICTED: alpha-2-HS-glycoprotein [Thamnophis sirtalis]|uniref:Alpha-2-HS-glycoprotein n=1 Tax=Thamnophis sirtalis TaxID=35019 RepID=A0A6I9YKC7_9SAUR|nr:PREDICTED: alpha-2-HS-glycoprotein [Thamnophis sirtalis]
MNSLVALVLLGQIIGCTLSHHLVPQLDCNGEEAEKLGNLAVNYINEHIIHGYKQALNIIEDIHVLPRVSTMGGKSFLVTKSITAVEADCDVKLLSDEGVDNVVAAKCHSEPDSVEDMQKHCPKCPILLSLSDPHVVDSANYVLHKHNDKLPDHAYEVLEISRGQQKVSMQILKRNSD